MKHYLRLLLSFDGRITRKTYWISTLFLLISPWIILGVSIIPILFLPSPSDSDPFPLLTTVYYLFISIIMLSTWALSAVGSIALVIKRAHDINSNGLLWLLGSMLLLIPFIILGCLKGEDTANNYGTIRR